MKPHSKIHSPTPRQMFVPIRSPRAQIVAEWFGLDAAQAQSIATNANTRRAEGQSTKTRATSECALNQSTLSQSTSQHAHDQSITTLATNATGESAPDFSALLQPRTITLVTGPSGSGKSSLLRQLRSGWSH